MDNNDLNETRPEAMSVDEILTNAEPVRQEPVKDRTGYLKLSS